MEVWELVARESIRDCIARYNAHGDAGRMDEMLSVFSPGASIDMDGLVFHGLEAMHGGFMQAGRHFVDHARASGARRGDVVLRHFTATTHITVTSRDTASASSYFFVLMAQGLDHWGSYQDEFERSEDEWRISSRRVVMEGRTTGSFAEQQAVTRAAEADSGT